MEEDSKGPRYNGVYTIDKKSYVKDVKEASA